MLTLILMAFTGVVTGATGGLLAAGADGLVIGGSTGLVISVVLWAAVNSVRQLQRERRLDRYFNDYQYDGEEIR